MTTQTVKHTPGPWMISELKTGGYFVETKSITHEEIIGTIKSEANARLIASAPELLEAIKSLYNEVQEKYSREGFFMPASFNLVEQAISKAERGE